MATQLKLISQANGVQVLLNVATGAVTIRPMNAKTAELLNA